MTPISKAIDVLTAKQDARNAWVFSAAEQIRNSTHRGWDIERNWLGQWEATGPNYDVSYEGPEDGWVSNGECVHATTRAEVIEEIDAWIEEQGK